MHHFVKKPTKRPPLINRGYFARCAALDILVEGFLKTGGDVVMKQIVSLGAGFDTRFFQLKASVWSYLLFFSRPSPQSHSKGSEGVKHEGSGLISLCFSFSKGVKCLRKYIEVDFPEVVSAKLEVLQGKQDLLNLIGEDVEG